MAALLKTTEADPTVPAALRADHLSGFDKPARPRRTRPAPAAAQAEVETLLATDPDAAAAALARHVDRFAGNATFLLWASQTFSELAAARPSHGLPDRTLATEAWAALLCTVVLPPGDDDQGLRLIDRPTGSTCAAPGCVARRSPGHCWPGRATTSTSAPSCGWRCWPATTGWPNGCSANR